MAFLKVFSSMLLIGDVHIFGSDLNSQLGITVGYEISLPTGEDVDRVLSSLSEYANAKGIAVKKVKASEWRVNHIFEVIRDFKSENGLESHTGEWPTEIKGLELFIHPAQEKMIIALGKYQSSWFGFGSVKTQSAPIEAHKEVVSVLDEVGKFGAKLIVRDDSGFYASRDERKLERTRGFTARLAGRPGC